MRILDLYENTIPRKFWMVFDIPTYNETKLKETISHLKNYKMPGVSGISQTKQIVLDFFTVARNAVLVMDSTAVINSNNIEQIDYSNPHKLLKNNMALLHRIWNKDPSFAHNKEQIWINIVDYLNKWLTKNGYKEIAHVQQYNGTNNVVGWYYKKSDKQINNLDDLVDVFLNGIQEHKPHVAEMLNEVYTEQFAKRAFIGALEIIGETYASEGEWIIKDKVLNIPPKSLIFVAIHKKLYQLWKKWKNNELTGPELFIHESQIKNIDILLNAINELKSHYNIKLADVEKFTTARAKKFSS